MGMTSIAFILWLRKYKPKKGMGHYGFIIFTIFITIILVANIVMIRPKNHESKIQTSEINQQEWHNFSSHTLSSLLESSNPVFVNMTASWCITCKVNEYIALNTKKTRNLFATNNVHYIKGDWTNHDSEITQYLNKFNRNGVPLYVYYGPKDPMDGKRPNPVILPQILTQGIILKTVSQ